MAQAPKLEMKQILGLKMTPELRQSLEILQLSAPALGEFVAKEIEANPILEFAPDWRPPKYSGGGYPAGKAGPDISEIEGVVRLEKTLSDHVFDQLAFLRLNENQTRIAEHLCGNLNKAGYLKSPVAEISAETGFPESDVETVLKTLQTMDPAGLFARDLKECLELQLRDLGEKGKDSLKLLGHLDLVAKKDWKTLQRETGLGEERLQKALRALRELDPKPGERFGTRDPLQNVIPDVFIRPDKDGGFVIELNPDTLPRILVNETYSTAFKKSALKKKEQEFLKTCKRRAGWLKRALDQRAKTVLRVSECLVECQTGFFRKGLSSLRPLTMREIAEKAEVHESTVSRVAANKYLALPRGIYPLRFFFCPGPGVSGEGASAPAIKERIRGLVGREPRDKPYSDEKLKKLLEAEGIQIARRTVMKYREALRIPSSVERRRR